MAPSRKVADAKAKAKKQKIIAIVGAVLLLGILAFEIPNTMKLMNQTNGQSSSSSSQSAATTTTTASTAPAAGTPPADGSLTPPTLSGSATASTPASSSGLVNSDPAPPADEGQLANFDKFTAKDPFKQQLAVTGSVDTSSSGGSSGGDKTSTTPDGSVVPPKDGGSTTTTPTTTTPTTTTTAPTPPVANPTTATISVNGAAEDVQAGGVFPKSAAQPYFKLVSLGPNWVKIGIAGGSLAGGDATVTLVKGKTLTLMNTADGTKYALQLVALK